MREATAEAIATRVLWQMRVRGRSEPWEAKLRTGYRDIVRAFASAMAGPPAGGDAAAQELRATGAAFERWFAWSERRQQYDDHMLDHLERIARDRQGLRTPQRTLRTISCAASPGCGRDVPRCQGGAAAHRPPIPVWPVGRERDPPRQDQGCK
jgi:hypothetical protein